MSERQSTDGLPVITERSRNMVNELPQSHETVPASEGHSKKTGVLMR